MEFGEAIQTCLTKYLVFSGRASRSEYWYFALFVVSVRLASWIGDLAIFKLSGYTGVGLSMLTGLLLIIPHLAVAVRRFHDTDHSGWLMIAAIVLLVFAKLISKLSAPDGISTSMEMRTTIISLVIVAVALVLTIIQFVWLVTPGTQGRNAYGPNPLASPQAQTV